MPESDGRQRQGQLAPLVERQRVLFTEPHRVLEVGRLVEQRRELPLARSAFAEDKATSWRTTLSEGLRPVSRSAAASSFGRPASRELYRI